jgi:hypothetical protein
VVEAAVGEWTAETKPTVARRRQITYGSLAVTGRRSPLSPVSDAAADGTSLGSAATNSTGDVPGPLSIECAAVMLRWSSA